jgi:head-tail adaptor
MTLTWDPGSDFRETADALEAVTLTSLSGSQTAISQALRMRISEQEAVASGGVYTRRDVKWHLPASALVSPPQLGATITDGQGQAWTIFEVDHDTRSSRYACWCKTVKPAAATLSPAALALLASLTERIHIQQAAWSKDTHGALVASWSNWRTNLAARIQPVAGVAVVEHEQSLIRVTHRVFLAEPVNITEKHRIFYPATGELFHVRGYESASRPDALFAIEAVKTPWQLA